MKKQNNVNYIHVDFMIFFLIIPEKYSSKQSTEITQDRSLAWKIFSIPADARHFVSESTGTDDTPSLIIALDLRLPHLLRTPRGAANLPWLINSCGLKIDEKVRLYWHLMP